MALRDVKEYYYTILGQYVETKADLADFEKALKDGHITEDQLEEVKANIEQLKINVDRIQYIMYLFELPKRKKKQEKFKQTNKILEDYFKGVGANLASIQAENETVLTHLRKELKAKLNNGTKQ